MANPNFWYARHFRDYAEKTAHLSLIEHGAYTLLLDHYYQTSGKLQANAEALLRICRSQSDAEAQAILAVADEFFPVGEDGMRHNRRADEEIKMTAELSAKRAAAGKRGVEKKKKTAANGQPNGQPNGEANDTANGHTITITNTTTSKEKEKEKNIKKKKTKSELILLPEDFCVTDRHRRYALEKGLPTPDDEIENFRDHHVGKKTKWADWDLAFFTWLRNAKKFSGSNFGALPPGKTAADVAYEKNTRGML